MLFTERNFDIVDTLRAVAGEVGVSMAQAALAWVVRRAGVSSVLIGASRTKQVTQNIAALDVVLPDTALKRLDRASAPPSPNLYFLFDMPRSRILGGHGVQAWSAPAR